MKKIIILISTLLILSCNKDDSSKVTPPENEVNVSFETIAKGNNPKTWKELESINTNGIYFDFKNDNDWNIFKNKYLILLTDNSPLLNIVNFNQNDVIAIIPYRDTDTVSVDIKKIKYTDTSYLVYYSYDTYSDVNVVSQNYHIVKTKKLDKKIIYIQQ